MGNMNADFCRDFEIVMLLSEIWKSGLWRMTSPKMLIMRLNLLPSLRSAKTNIYHLAETVEILIIFSILAPYLEGYTV